MHVVNMEGKISPHIIYSSNILVASLHQQEMDIIKVSVNQFSVLCSITLSLPYLPCLSGLSHFLSVSDDSLFSLALSVQRFAE